MIPTTCFKVANESITFHDGLHGQMICKLESRGDFIIQRADGISSYQLAVVVDDA